MFGNQLFSRFHWNNIFFFKYYNYILKIQINTNSISMVYINVNNNLNIKNCISRYSNNVDKFVVLVK